jgi:trigger factor
MQVTQKESQGLVRAYSVTVPAAEIEQQMEVELQSLGQKVKMPGFRPGHVPMSVLKQRYAKDVMGDVLQSTINKATREAVEKEKIRPAVQPDIKITSFEEGGDLSFDLTIEALPDVPAINYDKLSVDELTYEIPQSEVEEGLARLARSRQHPHTKEGAAEKGDVVTIDFLGKRDGEPFQGGEGKGFHLELGSNQFIPGFEEQLIGLKAGDQKTIEVTFPEQYHSADLAGQKATFDVTVHEVAYLHVPDVDDKLATSLGFTDLENLKGAVRQQIGFEYERMARAKAKKQLFDQLDEEIDFPIPERMVSMEADSIWAQVEEAKKAGDPSLKDRDEAELKQEYADISRRRVKLGILLAEIGRQNNIQVGREELSAAVMSQARNYPGEEDKVFEFYRKNPQQVDELRGPILEEKAVDFILAKTKRTKKPVTIEELMKEDEEASSGAKTKKKAKK